MSSFLLRLVEGGLLVNQMFCKCPCLTAELRGRKLIVKDKSEPRSLEDREINDDKWTAGGNLGKVKRDARRCMSKSESCCGKASMSWTSRTAAGARTTHAA